MEDLQVSAVPNQNIKHPSELEPVPTSAHEPVNGRFAAMAPYWLDGFHNPEGLKLAQEINALIKLKKLEENEEAIKVILKTHPDARKFGIGVFAEEYYLNDPWRKANLAEPVTLLDGALVRDKEGAYRPAAGGSPVLVDKGNSVVVKDLDHGPAAAVALMMAPGGIVPPSGTMAATFSMSRFTWAGLPAGMKNRCRSFLRYPLAAASLIISWRRWLDPANSAPRMP